MESDREPATQPADGRNWRRLGELLMLRRKLDLGYEYRPAFQNERGINSRLAADIENSSRTNFDIVTLKRIADGYAVTRESMTAVLDGTADELVPAGAAPAPPPAPLDTAPGPSSLTGDRAAAARPHANAIWQRLVDLAAAGVTDPSGAEVFGAGTPDARTWDDPNLRRKLTMSQMVDLLAEIHRIDAERAAGGNSSGAAGALGTGAVS